MDTIKQENDELGKNLRKMKNEMDTVLDMNGELECKVETFQQALGMQIDIQI